MTLQEFIQRMSAAIIVNPKVGDQIVTMTEEQLNSNESLIKLEFSHYKSNVVGTLDDIIENMDKHFPNLKIWPSKNQLKL